MKHGGERKGSQPISQEEGRVPAYEYWSWCLGSGNLSVWRRGRAPHTSFQRLPTRPSMPCRPPRQSRCRGTGAKGRWCCSHGVTTRTKKCQPSDKSFPEVQLALGRHLGGTGFAKRGSSWLNGFLALMAPFSVEVSCTCCLLFLSNTPPNPFLWEPSSVHSEGQGAIIPQTTRHWSQHHLGRPIPSPHPTPQKAPF